MKNITLVKFVTALGLMSLMAACSNQTIKGHGQYVDASGVNRNIVLQYKAQVYYIPFIKADVDYGSISLTTECLAGSLRDSQIDPIHGLIFTEATQNFIWVADQPKIKAGRHLVCAKLKNSEAIFTAKAGDSVVLQTFCEAKNNTVAILPANVEGYTLVLKADAKDAVETTEKGKQDTTTPVIESDASACPAT